MQSFDKVMNFSTYLFYKKYMKNLINKGITLESDEALRELYKSIYESYNKITTYPEVDSELIPIEILDDLAFSYFDEFFKGDKKLYLKRLINIKSINESLPVSYACIDGEEIKIMMKKYNTIGDIEKLFHEIMHIFIYKTENRHINSEILSQLFELIVASTLDNLLPDRMYYKTRVQEQIESLRYSLYLVSLYPSIDPVIVPYIKADLLANELYLVYLIDPEKFIYNLNRIFDSQLLIDDYLNMCNIFPIKDNLSKILENHINAIK